MPDAAPDRRFFYMAGYVLQVVATAAVTPVVTRLLGPANFGHVAAAVATVQVLFTFECLGLAVGVQRVFAEDDGGPTYARTLVVLAAASALVITAVLVALGGVWGRALGFDQLAVIRLTAVWGGCRAFNAVLLARLQSEDRVRSFVAVTVIQGVLSQLLGLAAVLSLHRSVGTYLTGLVVGEALACAVGALLAPPATRGLLDLRRHARVLRFTLLLIPLEIAAFVLNSSDRLVIQRLLGPAPAGRYSLAYNFAGMGATFLVVLNSAWMPGIFAAPVGPERARALEAARDQFLRLSLPILLGLAVGVPAVLTFWVPANFHPAGLLVTSTLVALATLPLIIYASEWRVFVAAGRSGVAAAITGAGAAVNIGLNLALVPVLGINGSAVATLASWGLLAALTHLVSRQVTPLARTGTRLRLQVLATTVVAAGSALVAPGGGWLVVRLVAAAGCVVLVLRALRAPMAQARGAETPPVAGQVRRTLRCSPTGRSAPGDA